MKILSLLFFTLFSAGLFAQGNLQFNQVINLKSGESYTVPSGKVLKIESMSAINGYIVLPYAGCLQSNPSTSYYYCTFKASLFSLGGLTDTISTNNGITSTTPTGCICNGVTSVTEAVTLPGLTFPIWLKAGQVVQLFNGGGLFLSGLEFNVTQ